MQHLFLNSCHFRTILRGKRGLQKGTEMAKRLHIIRHGKAEPFGLVSSDFQRTLAPRGAADAKKAGIELRKTGNFSGTSDFQSRASGSLHAAIDCRGTEEGSGLRSDGHSSLRGRNGGASRGGPGVSGFGGGGDALRTQSRSFGACGPPLCAPCHGMGTAEVVSLSLETDTWRSAGACDCRMIGRISSDRRE